MSRSRVTKWIESQPQLVVVLFAMFAAFAAYLSMYAFRKPLAANSYEGVEAFSLFGTAFHYKAIALISQLLGYMCSKFLGVKFASEAPPFSPGSLCTGIDSVCLVDAGYVCDYPGPLQLDLAVF